MRVSSTPVILACFEIISHFKLFECSDNLSPRVFIAASPGVPRGNFDLRKIFGCPENDSSVRYVEIRWYNIHQNVSLALYDREPKDDDVSNHLLRISPLDHTSGYFLTRYLLPKVELNGTENLSEKCMFYWVAVLDRRSRISSYDCFRGFPFWMKKSRKYLENVQVRHAFIPGTHNSGTYNYYVPHRSHSRVTQFVECQDESVFNQLFFGARYFELRASFSPKRRQNRGGSPSECGIDGKACDGTEFWSYHGSFVTLGSLKQIAMDIRDFLDSTEEIVLIDLHKFKIKGNWFWTITLHLELWKLLVDILGRHMSPFSPELTFGEMWKSNRRLIVSSIYPMQNLTKCLWPSPTHLWPNTEDFSQLELFFDQRLCSEVAKSSGITVTKGQLTPRPGLRLMRNIFRNQGGVRYFSPEINRRIDRMFFGKWACANVVAVDYLLSSDVVRIAIIVNEMRARNSTIPGRPYSTENLQDFSRFRPKYWRARDEL
ncbi:uncharacterized protein LOC100899690 [Galendromus occidentalis]|uniref:Uncharacterized protein LOC100899690 n=1 Tax=Galendromus occidentalis TaxID=34638 RepID=A0AAJ6QRC0_9ACAR|nr:uncharacterized protein LOC100899690 [Galendromus occidentalis]